MKAVVIIDSACSRMGTMEEKIKYRLNKCKVIYDFKKVKLRPEASRK